MRCPVSKLIVEPSPHIRSAVTTQRVMLDVTIALCPMLVAGIVLFGVRALTLTVVCCASCVLFEWLFCVIAKKERTISDLSAVVTGMLLAFNLPPEIPEYMAVIGSFTAIVVVKMLFGGIGQNFANPAVTARIVLMLSFSGAMTKWTVPLSYNGEVDAVASATPLEIMGGSAEPLPSLLDMFLGVRLGCTGETCVLAILIGGIYLVVRGIISPVTPLAFVGTVFVLSLTVGGTDYALYQIMSGGLMLGAVFMATDYSTTPLTSLGKLIFGVGCGAIVFLIRQFGDLPEGVSYAILLMNIFTPYIDKITMTRPIGATREGKK